MRRLPGAIRWPVLFVLVASLVFAGLGWVTYSALEVEQAQRETAARAELGNSIRVALWRLDGRMLPTLGVEDSRPIYHYDSADPAGDFGPAATPLLVATLPDWMQLHFQLDPIHGWLSNQAPTDEAEADRVREAWTDLPLRNWYGGRESMLAELKARYPVRETCELFAARDRDMRGGFLPFAAPLFAEVAPDSAPTSTPRPAVSPPLPHLQPSPKPAPPTEATTLYASNECYCLLGFDFGIKLPDLTNAGTAYSPAEIEKNSQRIKEQQSQFAVPIQTPGNVVMRGGVRVSEVEPGWADFARRAQTFSKGLGEAKQANDFNSRNSLQNYYAQNNSIPIVPGGLGIGRMDVAKQQKEYQDWLDVERFKKLNEEKGIAEQSKKPSLPNNGSAKLTLDSGFTPPGQLKNDTGLNSAIPRPVPPGEDRPSPPMMAFPTPVAVHLGSMRPQWITAVDGTDMLVLVRAAQFDGRTVYQGVVLDWKKLQDELHKEVSDLFPQPELIPVKDPAGVSPDRAMTALPVQLDPGPQPPLPQVGRTPLRIGLVLAWLAAIIAVLAVGFSGYSLIDLAERRIRFVSAVTHELRTPLTSLQIYLDLLRSGMIRDEDKQQEYLNTLATESDRLHRLIDNVLDFARLEKRRKKRDCQPLATCELLNQVQATWAARLQQDGMELIVLSTLPLEHEVKTDAAMVQQILGNLIDNARKYSADATDKRVWLRAKLEPSGGVVLEVEDRGPGVPPGERKIIFKPFRRGIQADASTGGAGLGLALARSWAEVLGGELSFQPADGGQGSCFRLQLPSS